VVSWKLAAEMKLSDVSAALVMPAAGARRWRLAAVLEGLLVDLLEAVLVDFSSTMS